jgi:MATE family multidrug resistance protein
VLALVRVNFDIFIRTLCLITGFAWFTAQGAAQGDTLLAANAVLLHFLMFMAYGLDGFAHAAETLVGGAVGARDRAAFERAVRLTTVWALVVALAFMLVYLAIGPYLIAAQTSIVAVRETAGLFLAWAVISPLIAVWSFQLDGIYIGATRTAEMRNGMILSLAALLVSGYAFLALWGNHGLWLSLLIFFAVRALTLLWWYPRLPRSLDGPAPEARHAA